MLLETLSNPLRKWRATNSTDNGFPSRIPRATEPSGLGDSAAQATASRVLKTGPGAGQNTILILPFGVGANNVTMSVRVIGWCRASDGSGSSDIWVPVLLAELACTLSSTPVGLAGKLVDETQKFADTITITYGNANVSVEAVTNGADVIAHALVDFKGCEYVELTFTTGAYATSCNALYKLQ